MQMIVNKIEECEDAEKMTSEDLEISGMTPSQERGPSSYGLSSLSHSNNSKNLMEMQSPRSPYGGRPLISSEALRTESDGSYLN